MKRQNEKKKAELEAQISILRQALEEEPSPASGAASPSCSFYADRSQEPAPMESINAADKRPIKGSPGGTDDWEKAALEDQVGAASAAPKRAVATPPAEDLPADS